MDTSARIAACLICTLAQCMRDCSRCSFNVGLPIKAAREQAAQAAQAAKVNTVLSSEGVRQNESVTV